MTATPPRYAIRYAEERWKDSRWFIAYLVVVLVVFSVFLRPKGQSVAVVWIPSIEAVVVGGAYLAILFVFQRISYLEPGADGLRLRYGMTSITIPYAAISRVRRQPLDVAFAAPERRRYRNRFTRRLGGQPAVYIRIDRRQEDLIAQLQRRLGPRFLLGQDIVLPITDPEGFLAAIKSRIRAG
jgi:hypothetical protein